MSEYYEDMFCINTADPQDSGHAKWRRVTCPAVKGGNDMHTWQATFRREVRAGESIEVMYPFVGVCLCGARDGDEVPSGPSTVATFNEPDGGMGPWLAEDDLPLDAQAVWPFWDEEAGRYTYNIARQRVLRRLVGSSF